MCINDVRILSFKTNINITVVTTFSSYEDTKRFVQNVKYVEDFSLPLVIQTKPIHCWYFILQHPLTHNSHDNVGIDS